MDGAPDGFRLGAVAGAPVVSLVDKRERGFVEHFHVRPGGRGEIGQFSGHPPAGVGLGFVQRGHVGAEGIEGQQAAGRLELRDKLGDVAGGVLDAMGRGSGSGRGFGGGDEGQQRFDGSVFGESGQFGGSTFLHLLGGLQLLRALFAVGCGEPVIACPQRQAGTQRKPGDGQEERAGVEETLAVG